MAKKKVVKTNAIRLVEQKKIAYHEYSYEWSENHLGAAEVATKLGQNPAQVFKTLVAIGNKTGVIVAVIPGNHELDLKKLAKASGNKKVDMIHLKDLEQTTGYIRGGCSPIGMKKLFPTFIDQTAKTFPTIIISAGKRGLQLEIAVGDLEGLVQGELVDLIE
ncbi:Cys-tRNA(Pro) deacylase [Enterococcus sp. SMC-9]|uniref:Cys-tRNA(Pro) deacylase n=1 Tax=Enterococcus sp. SMC-9 TaxID=2862343 RepID=UPI001E379649|nr:Cys-tRNA(Pro) deacylase [Enterococcus sp. SMC-9]MCD1023856.1 Cys-tRNA(Pro) deacylase [Enterococcus sp. SMC-9]